MKKTIQFCKNTRIVFVAHTHSIECDIVPEDFPAWERRPNNVIIRTPKLFWVYTVNRIWLKDGIAFFQVVDLLEAEFGNIVLIPAYYYLLEWDYKELIKEAEAWVPKLLSGTGVVCGQ